jgi:hypothetical protein
LTSAKGVRKRRISLSARPRACFRFLAHLTEVGYGDEANASQLQSGHRGHAAAQDLLVILHISDLTGDSDPLRVLGPLVSIKVQCLIGSEADLHVIVRR